MADFSLMAQPGKGTAARCANPQHGEQIREGTAEISSLLCCKSCLLVQVNSIVIIADLANNVKYCSKG